VLSATRLEISSDNAFSVQIHLHTYIHQHLWNLLVITPTTNVDAYLSSVYVGVDSPKFIAQIWYLSAINARSSTTVKTLWRL
jgi:hypothetical protein